MPIDALTSDLCSTYQRDGVVKIAQAFDLSWLESLAAGIEQNIATPGPHFEARTTEHGDGRYFEDFWAWSRIPAFQQFVRNSPAAQIAAQLLGATRINLVMDNWFLREAGAHSRAPWHHDIAYFDFEGSMCVLWLPLQATTGNEGISFVRGSHLWGKLFQRVLFKDHQLAGEAGIVNGLCYEPPPDIDTNADHYDIVSFDCAPGDCIVFDMRTLHGSPASSVPTATRSRFTLRMTAEDGRINYRGDWAKVERQIFESNGYKNGDAIDGKFFPQLWPAVETGTEV